MSEAIIVSIRVQALKDRWVQCARTWGHVSMQEPTGGGGEDIGRKMGRGSFWDRRGVCNNFPCIDRCGISMVELFQKTLERLWSNEVLLVHL